MKKTISKHLGGLHWVFTNEETNETLSVVCHDGSYGHEVGLFEILPSWEKPNKWDDVAGYLTFGQVQKWITKLEKRKKKAKA